MFIYNFLSTIFNIGYKKINRLNQIEIKNLKNIYYWMTMLDKVY